MNESYKCTKCGKNLPIGQSYVLVHVEIADKPVADYHLHIECFRKSLNNNSSLFNKLTILELMKKLEGENESYQRTT
jgi:hypothetical protein